MNTLLVFEHVNGSTTLVLCPDHFDRFQRQGWTITSALPTVDPCAFCANDQACAPLWARLGGS